jgi:hypothetical protein
MNYLVEVLICRGTLDSGHQDENRDGRTDQEISDSLLSAEQRKPKRLSFILFILLANLSSGQHAKFRIYQRTQEKKKTLHQARKPRDICDVHHWLPVGTKFAIVSSIQSLK